MSKLSYFAKVSAALILHSYQNYALFFYLLFPVVSLKADGVEWRTWCAFLREMLARNIFGAKKASPARGLAWEAIVDSLNEIHPPKFQLKDKKAVRERWSLLRWARKRSGVSVGFIFWHQQRRPRPSLFRPPTSPSPWKLSVPKVPIFNSVLSVFGYPDETQCHVFDIVRIAYVLSSCFSFHVVLPIRNHLFTDTINDRFLTNLNMRSKLFYKTQ